MGKDMEKDCKKMKVNNNNNNNNNDYNNNNPRLDWVRKVIQWKSCKKLRFGSTNKWYIYNPKSVPENETRKVFRDFKIHTDHLISTRRSDLVIVNNNKNKDNLPNHEL